MTFRRNTSNTAAIAAHLWSCGESFTFNLSKKVDIFEYSEKLEKRAERFEAWETNTLVGLLAGYFNSSSRKGFISNLSVLPKSQGNGLASTLLKDFLEHALAVNIQSIELQVDADNTGAIRLYERHGFLPEPTQDTESVRTFNLFIKQCNAITIRS